MKKRELKRLLKKEKEINEELHKDLMTTTKKMAEVSSELRIEKQQNFKLRVAINKLHQTANDLNK